MTYSSNDDPTSHRFAPREPSVLARLLGPALPCHLAVARRDGIMARPLRAALPALLAAAGIAVGLTACDSSPGSAEASPTPATSTQSAPSPASARLASALAADDVAELLAATRSTAAAAAPDVGPLLERAADVARDDPMWPSITYLAAEVRRLRAEPTATAFLDLADWAASDPYGDTWGGSALAGLALWRGLGLLAEGDALDADLTRRACATADELLETRLFRDLVRSGLLPALPQVREEVERLRAHLAWRLGDEDDAIRYFFGYLEVASSPRLDEIDRKLEQAVIDAGLATAERLELLRATRLLDLVRTREHREEALALLEKALDADNPQVQAEARYHLAYLKRWQKDRGELIGWLDQAVDGLADRELAQQALYWRARIKSSGDDKAGFRRDLEQLIERHPQGRLTDNALNQLGSESLFQGKPAEADGYYARLRAFDGVNDYRDSASFMPALGFITAGGKDDLARADRLLGDYLEAFPEGPFRLRSLFWRGRIAELQGDATAARERFAGVIEESPYDYYGIRARLHLERGAAAAREAGPGADSKIYADLRAAYRDSRPEQGVAGDSAYHARVRQAVDSGLYAKALGSQAELLRWQQESSPDASPRRLDDVPLAELDRAGLLPSLGLLLALRADAAAARDRLPNADNRLRLAGAIGYGTGDWPRALEMMKVGSGEVAARSELVNDPRYLATAYPAVFVDSIGAAVARHDRVPAALVYGVIREESAFYPQAVSSVGALGLVQFMERTFDGLPESWRRGADDRTSFLIDPDLSIGLWTRWAQERLLERNDGSVTFALIDHQAGRGRLVQWQKYWDRIGVGDDLELKVEAARFPATRVFVQRVLAGLWVADAAGFLSPAPPLEGNGT